MIQMQVAQEALRINAEVVSDDGGFFGSDGACQRRSQQPFSLGHGVIESWIMEDCLPCRRARLYLGEIKPGKVHKPRKRI